MRTSRRQIRLASFPGRVCRHLGLLLMTGAAFAAPSGRIILDPYAQIDWETVGRYRANFHTHTSLSDGNLTPAEAIDRYRELGYRILALTDHDTIGPGSDRSHPERSATTWPWQTFGREPETLGMLAVQGNEISRVHHIGSFFNAYDDDRVESEAAALREIGVRGGLAMLYHPGRYSHPVSWYTDLYRRYPHLIGLEVYNQGDRYSGDRATWDAILTELMPARPVWGYSNDDMHAAAQLGRNYNVMLLQELSTAAVRLGMERGWSYFVYTPSAHAQIAEPVIESVTVDHETGRIAIQATGEPEILWFSDGREVHRGHTLTLDGVPGIGAYVRAELRGSRGVIVGTQPFGLAAPARLALRIAAQPGQVTYADADAGTVEAVLTVRNLGTRTLTGNVSARLADQELVNEPFTLGAQPGTLFGFSFILVDDDDGQGFDYWMQMSPGIAGGWSPTRFPRFALGE